MNKTEFCGVSINRRFLHHSRSHPEVPSIPSLTMIGTITRAARGSAHHPPTSAFNKRPLAKGLVYRRPHYQEYCGADTQSGKLLGLISAGRENAPTLWQAAVSNFPLPLASTKGKVLWEKAGGGIRSLNNQTRSPPPRAWTHVSRTCYDRERQLVGFHEVVFGHTQ